jgi:type VI secretion system Hcp family effector
MAQYMSIDSIKGNVTTQGYKDTIQIKSMQHVSERAVAHRVGTSTREIGIPHLEHIQLSKDEDDSSALLWQYFYSGKVIPKVEITRCALNNGKAEWQSKITLDNVMVSSMHHQSHDEGGAELLTLSFSKIERSYRSQSNSGQWQAPKHTSFDIETAKVG